MTESIKDALTPRTQEDILSDLQGQRDALEKQLVEADSQFLLQQLFVNSSAVVINRELPYQQDATYQGEPVIIEVYECFRDNTDDSRDLNVKDKLRILVANKDDKILLVDLAVKRMRGSDAWKAEIGRYRSPTTLGGSNPGIDWEHAAGALAHASVANRGLLPEVLGVVDMMHNLATPLTLK